MLPPQDIHKPQGATFVVDASNSLHKERADFVCDGVDDQVEIQAAIDALPAGGGKVVLLEGIYDITQNLIVVETSNVSISGMGKSTLLKGRGTVGGSYKWAPIIGIDSASNVVISNLRCHGGMGVFGYGIHFKDSDNCFVSGCYAEYTYDDGIVFHNSKRCIAENNTCVGYNSPHGAQTGIEVEDGTTDVLLIGNTISDWAFAFTFQSHTGKPDCHNLKIIGNYCFSNGQLLSCYHPDEGYQTKLIITANTFIGGYRLGDIVSTGLILGSTQDTIIANNHFENFTAPDSKAISSNGENLNINNNHFENFPGATSKVIYLGTHIMDANINNNHIKGAFCGVTEEGSLGQNVIVNGNSVKDCTYGFRFWFLNYGLIQNNRMRDNTYDLYLSDGTDYLLVSNNVFSVATITVGANSNGHLRDNFLYTTENSGNSTGTGAQQLIAHGLAATPTKVILWNIEDGANPYQSAAADGTNIKITAVINQDYGWEAEVV